MSAFRLPAALVAVASLALGCDEANYTSAPVQVDPLAGTWMATSWVLSNPAAPTVRVDWGLPAWWEPSQWSYWGSLDRAFCLYLSPKHDFVLGAPQQGPATPPWGRNGDFASGTWTIAGDELLLTVTASTTIFPGAFSEGDVVRFTLGSDRKTIAMASVRTAWDFDACGQREEAVLDVTMAHAPR